MSENELWNVKRTIGHRVVVEGGKKKRERLIDWQPTWEVDNSTSYDDSCFIVKIVGLADTPYNHSLISYKHPGNIAEKLEYVINIVYKNPLYPSKAEIVSFNDLKDRYPRELVEWLAANMSMQIIKD